MNLVVATMSLCLLSGVPAKVPHAPRLSSYKNLTVLAIEGGSAPGTSDIITLDQGLKAGTVIVQEKGGEGAPIINRRIQRQIDDGPEVNRLWLINKSGKKLLLIAGELVTGGHQDRILQKDGLIPPNSKAVDLDVFCVEHGRWQPNDMTVGTGRAGFSGRLSAVASPSVRGVAIAKQSQEMVWNATDNTLVANKAQNESSAYRGNLQNKQVRRKTDAYVSAIQATFPRETATGVIVAIDGKPVWMDSFASNELFLRYWPKLLRSYALEATTKSNSASSAPILEEMLAYRKQAPGRVDTDEVPGRYKSVRIETKSDVTLELTDLGVRPPILLHTNKMRK